jgi:hypothetical protein
MSLLGLIHGSGLKFPYGLKGVVNLDRGRWVLGGLDLVDGCVCLYGGRLRGMYLISGVPGSGLEISFCPERSSHGHGLTLPEGLGQFTSNHSTSIGSRRSSHCDWN